MGLQALATRSRAVALRDDSRVTVVEHRRSVLFSTDYRKTWVPTNLTLKDGERMVTAFITTEGRSGIVAGHRDSVFTTSDSGSTWGSTRLTMANGEQLVSAAISSDAKTAVVAGNRGSVFMSTDGGQMWNRANIALKDGESIRALTWRAEDRWGKTGDRDSDGDGDELGRVGRSSGTEDPLYGTFIAETNRRNRFLLKKYPELANLERLVTGESTTHHRQRQLLERQFCFKWNLILPLRRSH